MHLLIWQVNLVAVSKTKPVQDIQIAYDLGHRCFGENYVQELMDKAAVLPRDIRWHFIGHVQSNKCKLLACKYPINLFLFNCVEAIPNLAVIESVDSMNKATALNKAFMERSPVRVFLQINSSQEDCMSISYIYRFIYSYVSKTWNASR